MATTPTPDIFRNVHKGIRKALAEACLSLGRAGDDAHRSQVARALLRDALRFVAHHGENEDLLLLPLLEAGAPGLQNELQCAHRALHREAAALAEAADGAPAEALYTRACAFTASYFQHMHDEEQHHEPAIRAVLSLEELAAFGRRSVERTAPDDQRMMLGFMLPGMTRTDAEAFLARIPAELAEQLRSAITA